LNCTCGFLINLVCEWWLNLHAALVVHYIQVRELMLLLLCFCRTYYKMYIWCNYDAFILWQVLYPIGCLTLYGLTECIINEWMNEYNYISGPVATIYIKVRLVKLWPLIPRNNKPNKYELITECIQWPIHKIFNQTKYLYLVITLFRGVSTSVSIDM
jgi:hypothetical protein